MNLFEIEALVILAVIVLALVVKTFAFVNALMLPAEAYPAANKLTKPAWLVILGLGLATQIAPPLIMLSPLYPIHLVFSIAAIVFLVDVRPAVSGLTRRK